MAFAKTYSSGKIAVGSDGDTAGGDLESENSHRKDTHCEKVIDMEDETKVDEERWTRKDRLAKVECL